MTSTFKLIRFLLLGFTLSCACPLIAQTDSTEIRLNIFPNPNQGTFYITTIEDESYNSQLFDMEGRLVKNIPLRSGMNYVSLNVPAGVYALRIRRGEESTQDFRVVVK